MATAKYKKNYRGRFEAKIWDGTYNPDGTKHRRTISSTKSSADLERKVAEFIAKRDDLNLTFSSDLSFYAYALQWLENSKATREKNTQQMYYYCITAHLSFLDDIPITEIRHFHFQQAINENKDHPRTCQIISLTFKQVIKAAVKDHILPKSALEDVITDISLPAYIKPLKRPLTALEKEAIKKADLSPMKEAFINVLFYLGLRREEALALTPASFDWDNCSVHIEKVVIFIQSGSEIKDYPKTSRSIRDIPMTETAVSKIKPYVDDCHDPFLFHGRTSDIMTASAFRRMWESIILSLNEALGYNPNAKKNKGERPITDLTPHIFRHNFCTELCYQVPQISTKMIAKLMGDTEKMVLDVYSHIVVEKEGTLDALDSLKL